MAVYGFQPRGSFVPGIPSVRRQFTQANAVAAAGDTAEFASGVVQVGTAGTALLGVYEAAVAANATNAGVNITPFLVVVGDADQVGTSLASTHVGTRFDLTGTTGEQLVDSSTTGASGQFVMLDFNLDVPPYSGDASIGVFMIAEHILYGLS